MQMHSPPHPGPGLKEAIESIPMTIGDFAEHIGVSRKTLSLILNGRAGVTAEMSMKISEAFGQGQPDIWFKVQNAHDFWKASTGKRKKIRALKIAA